MSVRALREALAAAPPATAEQAAATDPGAPVLLAGLAGELTGLGEQLVDSRQRLAAAQASLRLMLPPGVDPEHYGAWAVGASTPPADLLGRGADAVAADARLYVHFDRMRVALATLRVHNGRFATVIDLMAAATYLLEPSTFAMALRLVHAHVGQCRQMLAELEAALADFPRLFDALSQDNGARLD